MKSSCPCPAKDDTMEATPSPSFQCGLCQTNDHDITSPLCPTKRAATKKARRRRDRRSAKPSLQEASNEVATSNRYAVLASMDEDAALPTNVPLKQGTPSYSAAAKASHPKPRPSQPIPQHDPHVASCEETDIDLRLANLQVEIQRLEERRAQIRRRRQSSELQPSLPATQMTHPPNQVPASVPVSPRELLIFVAQQLQQLTSVLVAKLQYKYGQTFYNVVGRHFAVELSWHLWEGFVAYSSPSIMDRRSSTPSVPPGKVAAYVRAAFPQSRIDLSRWCTLWQEVVAVLVRLPRLDVIVVSYYARPYGGSAARCLGNHEFDDGPEGLAPFLWKMAEENIPVLGTNIDYSAEPLFRNITLPKSKVLTISGEEVAFLGVVTTETMTIARPA
ncbi:hypothetical protein HPB50_009318 [Hyalomma asiaticum]|uniref:Uncharacterized protein n=1 Tax=Hyalomma asiaticum TaxID=266040 RepID=A0ACB7T971_HYAAI|nr:hypothetical protein HPB50_009318 [Hyalomma asiaticum]